MGAAACLVLQKEVLVDSLEFDGPARANADFVLNHQLRQMLPVDQNDALGQPVNELLGLRCKFRGCDKNSLRRAQAYETAEERLNFRPANVVTACVSFRLHIDPIKSERILVDDTVNTAVAGLAKVSGSVVSRAAISHRDQKIDDNPFKEER